MVMNLSRRPVGAVNGIIFYTEMSHQCQEFRTKDNLNDKDNDNDYINNNQSINQSIIYLST